MRIGAVGNGMIVKRFLADIREVKGAEVTALCVRAASLVKGKTLADTYGVLRVLTDYQELLASEDVDAVYIGIINTEHYSYGKQALLAGKHVICEKPFTVSAWEAKELSHLAREKGLFLWEAFKIPYSPVFSSVREHLGDLGTIKLIHCNYSRVSSRYGEYEQGQVLPAFDPELAGGCLYDINLYNLHFTTALFGRPEKICYYPNAGFNGVDTSGTLILVYPGFHAVCTGAKDSSSPCGCTIQGTRGYIRTEGPASASVSAQINLGEGLLLLAEDEDHGKLTGELRAFVKQYEEGDYSACYEMLEHSLMVMELLEEAR